MLEEFFKIFRVGRKSVLIITDGFFAEEEAVH
jgi:hypothetical protein